MKIPHMGWNSLEIVKDDPLFKYFKNGEYVYYIIAEFESEPTPDDFIDFNYIIEEKYEQYFSEVSKIVVIYTQDYINYIENGFDDTVDVMGIIFPH